MATLNEMGLQQIILANLNLEFYTFLSEPFRLKRDEKVTHESQTGITMKMIINREIPTSNVGDK